MTKFSCNPCFTINDYCFSPSCIDWLFYIIIFSFKPILSNIKFCCILNILFFQDYLHVKTLTAFLATFELLYVFSWSPSNHELLEMNMLLSTYILHKHYCNQRGDSIKHLKLVSHLTNSLVYLPFSQRGLSYTFDGV